MQIYEGKLNFSFLLSPKWAKSNERKKEKSHWKQLPICVLVSYCTKVQIEVHDGCLPPMEGDQYQYYVCMYAKCMKELWINQIYIVWISNTPETRVWSRLCNRTLAIKSRNYHWYCAISVSGVSVRCQIWGLSQFLTQKSQWSPQKMSGQIALGPRRNVSFLWYNLTFNILFSF